MTELVPFSQHRQVMDYVDNFRREAKAAGLETQNHRFYITTTLMRRYMAAKEKSLERWMNDNKTCVTGVIRGQVHSLTIDYFDPADHQDFLNDLEEYLSEVLETATTAAKVAQAKARQAVASSREVQRSGWNFLGFRRDGNLGVDEVDLECDETPLLVGESSHCRRRHGFLN